MCGRFVFYCTPKEVQRQLSMQLSFEFEPSYNLCPQQSILAVFKSEQAVQAKSILWGLKPGWQPDCSKRLINARVESVHEKPSFKNLFSTSRCIILANGWYEWMRQEKSKRPFYHFRRDGRLLVFAGLIQNGTESANGLILTREAPNPINKIYHRMPFLLTKEQIAKWLSDAHFSRVTQSSIEAFDTSILGQFEVEPKVNATRAQGHEIIFKKQQNPTKKTFLLLTRVEIIFCWPHMFSNPFMDQLFFSLNIACYWQSARDNPLINMI
jgi:putative SOS response-associated peptidase YedK